MARGVARKRGGGGVIPVVVKVFERIVYEQLYAYLEEHVILCKHQSGFRAIHSTVTALLEATDSWAYNVDIGKINAIPLTTRFFYLSLTFMVYLEIH